MVAIIAALKGAGIAERDIQTARFSIQPVYAPQEPRTEPKLSGYSISNQVSHLQNCSGALNYRL